MPPIIIPRYPADFKFSLTERNEREKYNNHMTIIFNINYVKFTYFCGTNLYLIIGFIGVDLSHRSLRGVASIMFNARNNTEIIWGIRYMIDQVSSLKNMI